MIELLLKNVVENGVKIDAVINYINKLNKVRLVEGALIAVGFCTIAKAIKDNKERIMFLELELEEMKLKGE